MQFDITARQQEAMELYDKHRSYRAAAREMGISAAAFRRLTVRAQAQINKTKGLPPGQDLKGVSFLRDCRHEDNDKIVEWVKSDKIRMALDETAQEIIEGLRKQIPRIKKTKKPKLKKIVEDRMNGFVFGDSHINMLAWNKECPLGDWDIDIALARHLDAMNDLILRAPPAKIGFLATMGDLLHHDSIKPLTTEGTQVDTDGRLGKGYDSAITMLRGMLDIMLQIHEHVYYICVRGNHCKTLELILAKTIAIAYENEPRLTVLDNTCEHMLFEWEQNCLVFTHGDKMNDQKKADIVVSMFKQAHGRAAHSHLLSGHLHREAQVRVSGVLVETFAALPMPDAWHTAAGFVTSDQSATVLSYHKQGGITERTTHHPRILID